MRIRKIGRDALTGRFISVREAEAMYDTAVVETYPVKTHHGPYVRPARTGKSGKRKPARKNR